MAGPGEIYWLEQSAAEVPAGDHWLSAAETISLGMLRFTKRRSDWRLGRWTAKNAVARCLGISPDDNALRKIEIRAASCGAPEVFLEDHPAPVSISISHRSGLGACAVGEPRAAVGCDLEFVESHGDAFAADYFSEEERALLVRAPKGAQEALVALLWSAKESALKALRQGLRVDTRSVIVVPGVAPLMDSEDWHPLRAYFAGGEDFQGWWNQSRGFIRTVLTAPPPGPPILLAREAASLHH